jgi:hypothetical protein
MQIYNTVMKIVMPCILVKHHCSEGLCLLQGIKLARGEVFGIEGR